jgi:thiosulfate/3-mercaptopyruvate sulfurtransferase
MADYAHPEMLVECDWLQAHLDDPSLVIVDCDLPDQYRRAHISGAINPTVDHYYKDPADRRFIMGPETFAATMAAMGIGDDTPVVGYDASGGLYAARLWWCLAYYGKRDARVLNGGWNAWLAEGRPITMAEPPRRPPARFTPRPDPSVYASAEYIMAKGIPSADVVLLDVRSDGEWTAANDRGNRRAGRMPGAVHLEWLNNLQTDEGRRLKPAADLRAQFEALGVMPDKEIVTVCQGGIRASQAALALTLLGYERVRNYDGSFFDWANREDTPLEP